MVRTAWLLIFAAFALPTYAKGPHSAHRDLNKSYLDYVQSAHPQDDQTDYPAQDAYSLSEPYNTAKLSTATSWASEADMIKNFEQFRDHRWMISQEQTGFLRRSSWLYPDDGCYARAALAITNLMKWNIAAPSKIFVFGNLLVKTPNAPGGEVGWWYHVAPIVEVGAKKYVLDPAIEPSHPLELEKWLATMAEDFGELKVTVCHSGTYSPYDRCDLDSDGDGSAAQSDQLWFLDSEWSRLLELNRDPNSELGDNPPWSKTASYL